MLRATLLGETLSYPKVMDKAGVHHVFRNGDHGKKVNLDAITENNPLFPEILGALVDQALTYGDKLHLVGVANGANRLSLGMSRLLPGIAVGYQSEKIENDDGAPTIQLHPVSRQGLEILMPQSAVVIEDVGTTGSSSIQLVRELWEIGVEDVRVLHFIQRCKNLKLLEEAGVQYESIYTLDLLTLSPEECQSQSNGFCARGMKLLPYGS